jgi:hypothetical protein
LHPKFYKCIFFWNVKSTSNYSEKLKLAGIHTVTLVGTGLIHCCENVAEADTLLEGTVGKVLLRLTFSSQMESCSQSSSRQQVLQEHEA